METKPSVRKGFSSMNLLSMPGNNKPTRTVSVYHAAAPAGKNRLSNMVRKKFTIRIASEE